ncbi:MAG: DUF58 domain-containing protein [Pseudomonadota bacterium]
MIALEAEDLIRLRALVREGQGRQSHTGLPGGFVTRKRGPGLEIADLRAFHDGDDPRHIDRNATARSGKLQLRTFQAERDRTLMLLADFRPSMLWGTRRTLRSVAAAEALALAGWRAVADGGRVGALAVTAGEPVFVRPHAREAGMIAAIGGLLRGHRAALGHANAPEPPLADGLELARRLVPRGASVLLASALDTPGERFREAVQALRHRAQLSAIRIVDAFEDDAPSQRYRFATPAGRTGAGAPTAPAGYATAEFPDIALYRAALPPDRQPWDA